MNERIKLLAEQAGFRNGTFDGFWIDNDGVNRFAELIVRECANLHFRGINEISAETENKIYNMIKEHFGIEE